MNMNSKSNTNNNTTNNMNSNNNMICNNSSNNNIILHERSSYERSSRQPRRSRCRGEPVQQQEAGHTYIHYQIFSPIFPYISPYILIFSIFSNIFSYISPPTHTITAPIWHILSGGTCCFALRSSQNMSYRGLCSGGGGANSGSHIYSVYVICILCLVHMLHVQYNCWVSIWGIY